MLRANSEPANASRPGSGLGLFPCAVVTGSVAPEASERMLHAQSALNRVQVWVGDLVIDVAAWRKARAIDAAERATRSGPR